MDIQKEKAVEFIVRLLSLNGFDIFSQPKEVQDEFINKLADELIDIINNR